MIVTHKITMELTKRGMMPKIDAVQDDKYSRDIAISLYSEGLAWEPPSGSSVLIRYRKPDGKGGEYNTLPDDSQAYSISGNVVTVALAPQVLTVAGAVWLNVVLISASREISTFSILVEVQPNVGTQIAESDDYENVTPPVFIDPSLTKDGQAADAKVTGDAVQRLSGETSALRQEVAVERARMDTFTALEEGSTTGDAELVDIRVGFDAATTYDTAGAAVRGQVKALSDGKVDNDGTAQVTVRNCEFAEQSDNIIPVKYEEGVYYNVHTDGTLGKGSGSATWSSYEAFEGGAGDLLRFEDF